MSNDKEKLLQIMASLESDYAHGKISKEKYVYFRSKYEDRLNALDAREATNRIRSMQGKPSDSPNNRKPIRNEKKEDEDLVQKYIINPKKGDKQVEPKVPMDSGTFKLVAILVLAIGFTVGAGFGVFNFDFGAFTNTNASAIVTDTAFPNVADVHVNTTTSNVSSHTTNYTSNVQQTQSSYNYVTPTSSDSENTPVTPEGGGGGSGNNTG
ncbi:endoglucanase [Methanobrevibacter sp.]|uniref:endoglucanase n=1 Tax=Methanobrevibacter sp. TaxID=66852 RepID=UPI0025E64FCD|nr:endoglucanase [Methanobrevibacter sp.]MEE0025713.1 endoglucanase [Methanobrevibacter sp.]